MDWKWMIIFVMTVVAFVMGMRYRRLRKEVDQFAAEMEQSLDAVIAGHAEVEVLEDSLFAKLQEKLLRTNHIFALREQKNKKEREQLQSLISDISHQSRIPIANQRIYLDLLAEEVQSEEGMQALRSLEHQTERLQFLMESMIKLSRMESGMLQIKKMPQDLMETIRKAVAENVVAAAKKKQQISVDGPAQLATMHDARWTMEAIGNVLENAVKYTDEGGRINVTVRRQEMFTVIEITDNGRGIAPERQAQIFGRFYREPEVHEQPGIGIGLYLTRKIIEAQDGYVDVVSQPDEGATFRLHLQNANVTEL